MWNLTSIEDYRKLVGANRNDSKARMTAAEYVSMAKGEKVAVKRSYSGKEKFYIERVLGELGIDYVKEYRFDKVKRFRFDIAIPQKMLYIEFDGLMSAKSRHTTVTGFSKDQQKFNLAASLGWRGYRYSVLNFRDVEADLKREFGLSIDVLPNS